VVAAQFAADGSLACVQAKLMVANAGHPPPPPGPARSPQLHGFRLVSTPLQRQALDLSGVSHRLGAA
jgi:hypothetical protein